MSLCNFEFLSCLSVERVESGVGGPPSPSPPFPLPRLKADAPKEKEGSKKLFWGPEVPEIPSDPEERKIRET